MARAASRCIAGVTWLWTSSVMATVEWPSVLVTFFLAMSPAGPPEVFADASP
jgi:hypothetical protein